MPWNGISHGVISSGSFKTLQAPARTLVDSLSCEWTWVILVCCRLCGQICTSFNQMNPHTSTMDSTLATSWLLPLWHRWVQKPIRPLCPFIALDIWLVAVSGTWVGCWRMSRCPSYITISKNQLIHWHMLVLLFNCNINVAILLGSQEVSRCDSHGRKLLTEMEAWSYCIKLNIRCAFRVFASIPFVIFRLPRLWLVQRWQWCCRTVCLNPFIWQLQSDDF